MCKGNRGGACDLDALPANVIPYVRRAIDNYRAGRWFDSFGWGRP